MVMGFKRAVKKQRGDDLQVKNRFVLFSSTQNAAVLRVAPSHVTLTPVSVAVNQESPGRAVTAAW